MEVASAYQPVSDITFCEVLSFTCDTVGLPSVLNLAALLRIRKHLLLYDSRIGIISRIESIPARGKTRNQFLLPYYFQ
ncbi:mCG148282 [Mus musculus]|nr:mCG148282 [Mus musculus]